MGETTVSESELLAEVAIADLDRRLAHVSEPGMRRRLVRDALAALAPDTARRLIGVLLSRPPAAGPAGADRLGAALHEVLLAPDPEQALPYAWRSSTYAAARDAGDEPVLALLRAAQDAPSRQPKLPQELVEIPLGRRRSLARGDDRTLLELLARDVDPLVIRHLLRNPRIRETEVLRIAAARPALGSCLEEIHRSPRFGGRMRVREALASNPHTPAAVVQRLLPTLTLASLKALARDPSLDPARRARLDRELDRRRP